jgi:hypothetical protein
MFEGHWDKFQFARIYKEKPPPVKSSHDGLGLHIKNTSILKTHGISSKNKLFVSHVATPHHAPERRGSACVSLFSSSPHTLASA